LSQGIVLVDTPGLGSLARRGAAETMAYLPTCDLALVLIDAGATLNDEDLGTLRLLYEAGISAIVLLSKADLLADRDLQNVATYIETQVQDELRLNIHVQPVSALPNHSGLLTHFFEGQLLPRFNQARNLRRASVARKIGALRESVIAALDTSLQRGKRQAQPTNDGKEIEASLRHISGEIGEQRSRLDRAFLELGERPEVIFDELAERSADRICSGASTQIDSSSLAEWAGDAIQKRVDLALSNTSKALRDAVSGLRKAATEIARSEMPTEEEAEALLRNAPRFEMASLPRPIGAVFWRWCGRKIATTLARQSLRQQLGESFKDELHRYGRALSQWGEHTARRMDAYVNSYADAYRAQLGRMHDQSPNETNSPELASDLSRLVNWNVGMAETRN
jgi:hypothetical protein